MPGCMFVTSSNQSLRLHSALRSACARSMTISFWFCCCAAWAKSNCGLYLASVSGADLLVNEHFDGWSAYAIETCSTRPDEAHVPRDKGCWQTEPRWPHGASLAEWRHSAVKCAVCLWTEAIDHFTYYCLGSQGGKLWVAMRLLGPIACRQVRRNTAETRKTISLSFWIVGFQFQLFLQTIGLDAATSSPLTGLRSIVLPLELNVRVRLRRRSSLPSQTLVLPLQLPSRKARQVREELAEAGKQIEEHNLRNVRKNWSVYLPPRMWECQLKSCALAYSLLRTWKETTISWGIHFWINSVCRPVGSSLESVGYWVEGENPQPKVCCERGKRQEERERFW